MPTLAAVGVSTVAGGGGLTLSYAEQGRGSDPALVLLPGPTDSWHSYQPVLDRLPPDIATIALSQRGHGDSDKPPTGYRVEDFAADVVPFLDEVGIERAVLAGHSGSCLVARRVALDDPNRVAGLILEASPTTLRGHARLEEFVTTVVASLRDPIGVDFARSFLSDTSSNQVPAALIDQLVGELVKVPARVWREMFAALLHYDDLAEVDRISAPTLLIWGEADELVTRNMQHELECRITTAELRVYPGAGHTPRWEDPGRFAADIAAFVRAQRGLAGRP